MKETAAYIGPSICSILGLIFIVLKLVGVIDWSWLWILAPFWIPILFVLLVLVICMIFLGTIFKSKK